MSDATGRALYVHDDIDGYAAILAWDGPPRRAGETAIVHTVTLAYGGGDSPRALSELTITYPGKTVGHIPPLPTDWRPDLRELVVTFYPGMMGDDAVQQILRIVPAEHRPHLPGIFAALGRIVGDQWRRELQTDDLYRSRPSATLDRDRTLWPDPDEAIIKADLATIEADLAAIEGLRAIVARAVEVETGPPAHIPDDLPFQTSMPPHLVQIALADAPTRRGYSSDDQSGEITHGRPGEGGRVTVVAPTHVLGLPVGAFWSHTTAMTGVYGVAVASELVSMIREDINHGTGAGMVTIALDDLARAVKLRQQTQAERLASRALMFSIVRMIASMRVEMAGTQTKVRTGGRLVDMSWYSPLIVIEDVQMPTGGGQLALDGSAPAPHAIRYRGSDVLLRHARIGNRALPVLGETVRRDAIPAGQPSGSWARAICTAVVRLCRTKASYTVSVRREILLTMYAGAPHPDDLLSDGRSARRAVTYWAEALAILQTLDGGPMFDTIDDPPAPEGRGWTLKWRRQVVTLRVRRDAPEVKGLDEVIAGREAYDASMALPAAPRRGRPRRARAE